LRRNLVFSLSLAIAGGCEATSNRAETDSEDSVMESESEEYTPRNLAPPDLFPSHGMCTS
jgi:hypothetical protein